jgi:hypothetical protein
MIPPEIELRRSREREVEVRHPFLQVLRHHIPDFLNPGNRGIPPARAPLAQAIAVARASPAGEAAASVVS